MSQGKFLIKRVSDVAPVIRMVSLVCLLAIITPMLGACLAASPTMTEAVIPTETNQPPNPVATQVTPPTPTPAPELLKDVTDYLKGLGITVSEQNSQVSLSYTHTDHFNSLQTVSEILPGVVDAQNQTLTVNAATANGKENITINLADLQIYHNNEYGWDELVAPITNPDGTKVDINEGRYVLIDAYDVTAAGDPRLSQGHFVEDRLHFVDNGFSFNPRLLADGFITIDQGQSSTHFKDFMEAFKKAAGSGNILVRFNDPSKLPANWTESSMKYMAQTEPANFTQKTVQVNFLFKSEAVVRLQANGPIEGGAQNISSPKNPYIAVVYDHTYFAETAVYFETKTEKVDGKDIKILVVNLTSWTPFNPDSVMKDGKPVPLPGYEGFNTFFTPNEKTVEYPDYWIEKPANQSSYLLIAALKYLAENRNRGVLGINGVDVDLVQVVNGIPSNPPFTLTDSNN